MSILFADYDLLAGSSLFDPEYYVSTNPEIGALNIDPVLHYLESGAVEKRNPSSRFDAAYYLEQCRMSGDVPRNPLIHYLTIGAARGLKPIRDSAAHGATDRDAAPDGGAREASAGRAAETDPAGESMLSIDGAAFADAADGGRQVSIMGWALAPEPVSRVTIECNGAPLGAATLGLERLDVAQVLPKHAHASNSGFSLLADLPDANRAATLNLDCSLTTATGRVYRHQRRVLTSPAGLKAPDAVVPIKRARVKREAMALRLEVDEAIVDEEAILSVNGWAAGLVEISAITVYVDDEPIGRADHGRIREDVALALKGYPGAGTSGFGFNADLTRFGAGERTVKIEAESAGGIRRHALIQVSIPARTQTTGDGHFHFFCDARSLTTTGEVSVAGWLIAATTTESISVLLDEIEIGRATIGRERVDVGRAFPHIVYARNSGFVFRDRVPQPIAAGEHQLVLRVRDAAGHVRDVPLPVVAEDVPELAAPEMPDAGASPVAGPQGAISLSIDAPSVTQGVADRSVIGTLSINGWALAPAGIRDVAIAIDGTFVANAQHGIRRDDVANAFPDRPEALQSGFATVIPYWLLPKGSHTVSLTVRDLAEHEASVQFGIEVEETPEGDGPWSLRRKMSRAEIDVGLSVLEGLAWRPQFAIVIRAAADEASIEPLRRTLLCLLDQGYPDWRASVVDQPGKEFSSTWQSAVLQDLHVAPERVRFCAAPDSFDALCRGGTAAPSAEQFIVPLSAGDELGCDALLELATAGGLHRDADFLFADERCVSSVSNTRQAYFKPGWSPDLLRSTNYVGRPWCASAAVFKRAGLSPREWLVHGDYDLVLRATEAATGVRHLAKVLCSRGAVSDSAALERRALTRALARRRIRGRVEAGCAERFYRVIPKKAEYGRVSIIIPTRASRGLIKICLDTLKAKTAYRDFEIICIENIPDENSEWKTWLREQADQVLETAEPFNWSRYNNLCAARATGRYFLFLNDDIEVLEPDWLDTMLYHASRPEVGVVGPQLLYPDRTVQHAGLALTGVLGRARHVFRHGREDDPGYFGLALAQRNVIAVTGACMLMKRETFDALGGFDEAYNVINNDLDFCLRSWKRGLLNVYTPHTRLIHHEMISRAKLGDAFDSSAFITAWRDVFLDGDPYLNRNLSRDSDDLLPEREPITTVFTGNPLFARASIRRILVLKLDHIGDCITALPALRKLKRCFPEARITVLSGSATRLVWSLEAVADDVLEFNFFHARSQLGTVGVSEEALAALGETLAPHRFDLAIDLRKSPDTRHVLKYTGAKYLAGFDYQSQFPWLDVALEWEGDPGRTSKRKSIADDLINLVDAVQASGESARQPLARRPKPLTSLQESDAAGLFDRPLVCIHAGAGNDLKAWPAASFRELIDLLVERDEVQVALIGGPAESALSDEILRGVREPTRSRNLAGKLKLDEIPDLFLRASLFIGNDSGPKHIAAALGVPTVGIHSGNIDAREWGPVGPHAVAVWRQTSCSPCYIDQATKCPRQLACLHGIGAGEVYRLCRQILKIGAPNAALEPAESSQRLRGAPVSAVR